MVASGVGRGVLGTISCPLPQILREDYYFHLQLILLVRVYNIFKQSPYFHFRIDRKDLVIRSGEFPSEVVTETCPSPPVFILRHVLSFGWDWQSLAHQKSLSETFTLLVFPCACIMDLLLLATHHFLSYAC